MLVQDGRLSKIHVPQHESVDETDETSVSADNEPPIRVPLQQMADAQPDCHNYRRKNDADSRTNEVGVDVYETLCSRRLGWLDGEG